MLTEHQRELLMQSGSGALTGFETEGRKPKDWKPIVDKIDRAIWEAIKLNPSAFQMKTIRQYMKMFYNKENDNG